MKVRKCYTAYACGFFAIHADAYDTSSGTSVPLVNQAGALGGSHQVICTGAAASAHNEVVAAEKPAAQARESATQQREQKNGWRKTAGDWLTGTANDAWNGIEPGWNSGIDFLQEHKEVVNIVMAGVGIAAFAACIVSSAGSRLVIGGVVAGAGYVNNRCVQGDSVQVAGSKLAKNLVFAGFGGGVGYGIQWLYRAGQATAGSVRIAGAGTGVPGLACAGSMRC